MAEIDIEKKRGPGNWSWVLAVVVLLLVVGFTWYIATGGEDVDLPWEEETEEAPPPQEPAFDPAAPPQPGTPEPVTPEPGTGGP